jgi:hypothetical protein
MAEGKGGPVPWAIGLLGLALMVGGWKLMSYVPPPASEQERQLDELRAAAEKSARAGDPAGASLDRKLPLRALPYKMPGQIAVYGGLLLFVVAGVLMYRHKPAPEPPPEGEEAP